MKIYKPILVMALKILTLVLIVYHLYLSCFRTIIAFENFNNSIEYYKMIGSENVAWSSLLSGIIYNNLSIIFDISLAAFIIGKKPFIQAKKQLADFRVVHREHKMERKEKKIEKLQKELEQ